MNLTLEQFGIDRLSCDEKLQLIDLLWESMSSDEPPILSDELKELLDRRLEAADANPQAGESWDDLYARLSRKK
jgi:putative addiction module component (TIGR02574 family)